MSVSILAEIIQHAVRMLRIVLPSVGCLVVPYFSTLCHTRHDALKKKILKILFFKRYSF